MKCTGFASPCGAAFTPPRRPAAALRSGAAAAAFVLIGATAASAHHSFSMFDIENNVTIEGEVAEVQWTNPHAWVEVDVVSADGETRRWGVEFNSPNNLTRQGWKRDDIRVGDHIVITVSPLHDGQPGGLFYEVALPDGRVKRDPRADADIRRAEEVAAVQ